MPVASPSVLAQYAATGDPECFRQLVEAYHGLVRSACLRVLKDQALADDTVQETFLTLARKAASVHGNLAAWLHTTATHHAIDLLRSERCRQARERAAQAEAACSAETDVSSDWSELREELDASLAELDAQVRDCVVRHYLLGHHYAAIASDLGLSPAAVHKRVQNGLAELRQTLARRRVAIPLAALAALLGGPGRLEAAIADPTAIPQLTSIALAVRPEPAAAASWWKVASLAGAGLVATLAGLALWLTARPTTATAAPAPADQAPPAMPAVATTTPGAESTAIPTQPPVASPPRPTTPVQAVPPPAPTTVPAVAVPPVLQSLFSEPFSDLRFLEHFEYRIWQRQPLTQPLTEACLSLHKADAGTPSGHPDRWLQVRSRHFGLLLRPRCVLPQGTPFRVSYRMRLAYEDGEAPVAALPWPVESTGWNPNPTARDREVRLPPVGASGWYLVESDFRPDPVGGAWNQTIVIDGALGYRGTAETATAIQLRLGGGIISLAGLRVDALEPVATVVP
jgi:RNA polymerase sigma factor (sigma-70 family)